MPSRAAWARSGRASVALCGLAVVAAACSSQEALPSPAGAGGAADGGPAPVLDGGVQPVRAVFDPQGEPLRFGSLAWPDDLHRDSDGRVRVQGLAGGGLPYLQSLADAYGELDGFGVTTPVYFRFEAPLRADSLPATPEESLQAGAAAFLIDADTSSPTAFQRVPAEMRLREGDRQLVLWPAAGHVLAPGRRYAAVVTRAVRSTDGRPVEGSERFVAIRDPEVVLDDPLDLRARAQYTPVLETLDSKGVAREDVIALAVFTVQTVGRQLSEVRERVRSESLAEVVPTTVIGGAELDAALGTPMEGQVGLDAPGGAPHEGLGWLVHGTYRSPNLLSSAAGTRGSFERRESGELRVKRRDDVHFSLLLPRVALDGSPLPVVIVQHGWGGERSQALAVGNALAGAGYAVFSIDAPFHGLRAKDADSLNRFTGDAVVDGFGDVEGDFAGLLAEQAPLGPLHPFYYRDTVRQTVVDLMVLVRLIQQGDWGAVMAEMPDLAGLAFDGTALGFVGVDVGAEIGLSLASQEDSLGALALAFTAGASVSGWAHSPGRAALFDAIVTRVGGGEDVDFGRDPPAQWPAVSTWQALIDAADGAAHAARVRRRPVNTLLWVARDDEVVPNAHTEALAWTLGATLVGGAPLHQLSLKQAALAPGDTLSANFTVGDDMLTRVLYALDPATHDTLERAVGMARHRHPLARPFTELAEPRQVDNPIRQTLMQLVFFFQSWRACIEAEPGAVCSASVPAP